MATLNIKAFPEDLYARLKELAEQEHRSLTQQVIHELSLATERPRPGKLSILGLRGLGKQHWKGADVAAYLEEERNSWDS